MKPDLKHLSNEELKRKLHNENFKFTQGIENGTSFNELKQIRQNIRLIQAELESRITSAYLSNRAN